MNVRARRVLTHLSTSGRRRYSVAPNVSVDQERRVISMQPSGEHTATVIYCHGLGDTANGWAEPCYTWAQQMPWIKFILPTAPVQPVTLNGGMKMESWYDIHGLSEKALESAEGIEDSKKILSDFIDIEKSNGIEEKRIILAGFSQGAALSLYTGLSIEKLGGIIAMSGYLPNVKDVVCNLSKNTPILQCHGTHDPMVPIKAANMTNKYLKEHGYDPTYHTYKGLQHSANPEELEDVRQFLNNVLPRLKNDI